MLDDRLAVADRRRLGRGMGVHRILGTLKNVSVLCPLFSAFGPDPVVERMTLGDARVLVTTQALYRRKVADRRAELPGLKHVVIVGPRTEDLPGTVSWGDLMAGASEVFTIPATDPEDVALLHFTSGTTGRPKGALHVHGAVAAHRVTAEYALDLRPDDVYWCTADPGWPRPPRFRSPRRGHLAP
jgi:acetyl-CoA synthetase